MTQKILVLGMPKQFFVGSIILLTLLTGCTSEPPTVGEPTELEQVCDPSNDGERVAVEGFLTLPERISLDDTTSVLLEVRPTEDVRNLTNRVGIWTSYGSQANQVAPVNMDPITQSSAPPESNEEDVAADYTHDDLKVTASDGQSVAYTDRVRVSGKVGFPSSLQATMISACVLTNPLIERIR